MEPNRTDRTRSSILSQPEARRLALPKMRPTPKEELESQKEYVRWLREIKALPRLIENAERELVRLQAKVESLKQIKK